MEKLQRQICDRIGATFMPPDDTDKVGIAEGALRGDQPLNGLRHRPDAGTTGWFLWGGTELLTDPDFFKPLHVSHLRRLCPTVLPYLALPPGWRFLTADGYEDIWFDRGLLDV